MGEIVVRGLLGQIGAQGIIRLFIGLPHESPESAVTVYQRSAQPLRANIENKKEIALRTLRAHFAPRKKSRSLCSQPVFSSGSSSGSFSTMRSPK